MKSLYIGFLVLFTLQLDAANLSTPFDLESTGTLPSGIRNPRYKHLFVQIQDKFDNLGLALPLDAGLNKKVTWADAMKSLPKKDQVLLEGALAKEGQTLNDSPGSTLADIKIDGQVYIPAIAMGITENFTLGVAAPVYNMKVNAQVGFDKTPEGASFHGSIAGKDPDKANQIAKKMNQAINGKVTALGYDPVESTQVKGFGDAKIIGKWRFLKSKSLSMAVKSALTVPTGIEPDANKLIDVPTGDGQWDVGFDYLLDYNLTGQILLNTQLGYTAQLPDQLDRRIPIADGETLTPDIDMVDRDLGDQVRFALNSQFGDPGGLSFGLGYSIQYMAQTRYSGNKYEAIRYKWLEETVPEQVLQSAVVKAGYSTISAFKRGSFPVPFQTYLVYSHPVAGRNVNTNDVFSADMVLFF
jgi:hypothetical protein